MAEATAIVTSIPPKPATPDTCFVHVYNDGANMRVSQDFWCADDAIDYLADTSRDGYAYTVELTPDGPVKHDFDDAADEYRAEQHAELGHQIGLSRWYHGSR